MEVQRFEQAILKMAFETDAKITTASVAYYLGIPSRKANELLEALLAEGVLELDSDDQGNLFYFVPNQSSPPLAAANTSEESGWKALEEAADFALRQSGELEAVEREPREPTFSQAHFTSSVEDEETPPIQLKASGFSPERAGSTDGYSSADPVERFPSPSHSPAFPQAGSAYDFYASPQKSRQAPARGSSRFDGLPEGIAARLGRPDARPDRCGNRSSLIVESAASCEPKPLAESRPTVTSCAEVDTPFSSQPDYSGFGFTSPRTSTALATTTGAGELTLSRNQMEQPEHQPGMALLLSLILSGTGQIYNGEVSKGIIMLILTFLLWFVFLGWVVHIWSIVDAVVVAERINRNSNGQ